MCVACSKSDDDSGNTNIDASKLRPTRVLISDFLTGSGVYKTIEYTYNNKDLPVLITIYDATFINGIYTNADLYASINLRYTLETNNLEQMTFDFHDFEFEIRELNFIYGFNSNRISGIQRKSINSNNVLGGYTQQYSWSGDNMRYSYTDNPADGSLSLTFDDEYNLIARTTGLGGDGSFERYYDYDNSAPIFFHDLDNAKNLNEMFSFIDAAYFPNSIRQYFGLRYPVNLEDTLTEQQTTEFNDKGFVTKYFVDSLLSYDIEYETFE
ncbi:MAG: hypothetical protein WA775_05625 [Psychroserpens sp.]|uniref:hypothetical protein n=1 Tax=Psychroserpens sp. TaxID=2020870 RepID=UPI003C82F6AA